MDWRKPFAVRGDMELLFGIRIAHLLLFLVILLYVPTKKDNNNTKIIIYIYTYAKLLNHSRAPRFSSSFCVRLLRNKHINVRCSCYKSSHPKRFIALQSRCFSSTVPKEATCSFHSLLYFTIEIIPYMPWTKTASIIAATTTTTTTTMSTTRTKI